MSIILKVISTDGTSVEFHGGQSFLDWRPLSATQLREYWQKDTPLELKADAVLATIESSEGRVEGRGDVSFEQRFNPPISIFGLIPGGWLPAVFCEASLLLVDANIAGKFSLMEDEVSRAKALKLSEEHPTLALESTVISPLFAAYEGDSGGYPSIFEYWDRSKKLARRLEKGFPGRKIEYPSKKVIAEKTGGLLIEAQIYKKYANYLKQVYSHIAHRIPDDKLLSVHAKLEEIAKNNGVSLVSFLHLLAIDCLYDEGPKSKRFQYPGRLVLKPKKDYSVKDLSNPVMDVLHIERLCHIHASRKTSRPVFCTQDCGLAQAWAMLKPTSFRMDGDLVRFNIEFSDSFAHRLTGNSRREFIRRAQS